MLLTLKAPIKICGIFLLIQATYMDSIAISYVFLTQEVSHPNISTFS